MSYYIIPKINNLSNFQPNYSNNLIKTYISHSLFYYFHEINKQIYKIIDENTDIYNYEDFIKIINPYEYIFSKVPGSKYSVSKLRPKTNLFYDFLEVSSTLNIFESFKNQTIKSLHISKNSIDTTECFEMIRENYNDEIVCLDEINDENLKYIGDIKFHFLFFETKYENLNNYFSSLVEILLIILRNHNKGGNSIIKVSDIFYKPVIDFIYILSSFYEKIYIIKPNSNNITSFEKYIVCKNFQTNEDKNINIRLNYFRLLVFLKKMEKKNIQSLLDFEIPYYFTMKLDDINIIIGQQQLDSLNLLINILKNKNKEDKMESLKKSNIQKAVSWCEKYKIPCNKFTEKTNIFLPIYKEFNSLDTEVHI